MYSRISMAAIACLLTIATESQSAPIITNIQITPTPLDHFWIAPVPVKGSNLSSTVSVSMTAMDLMSTECKSFVVGVWVNGQCQPALVGLTQIKGIFPSAIQSSCTVTSQSSFESLRAVAKQTLEFSIAKGSANIDLAFCAYNSAQQQITSANYKASYGDPVARINVTAAKFSNSTRKLTVSGNVVPKGRNNIDGAPAEIIFPVVQPIMTTVSGRRFTIQQEVSSNPEYLQVQILNGFSQRKRVRLVR